MPNSAHRDLAFLHRFEQGRLRFRGGAVDLVGQNDVRKNRTGEETHLALAGRAVLFNDVGAGDIGRHQIGRELDAAESEIQRTSQRAYEQRFRKAWHAFQEAMTAAKRAISICSITSFWPTMTRESCCLICSIAAPSWAIEPLWGSCDESSIN